MLPSRRLVAVGICLVLAMASLTALWTLHRAAIGTRTGQRVEEYARWAVGAQGASRPLLELVVSTPFLVGFTAVVLAWVVWSARSRGWDVLVGCVLFAVCAFLTTQVLKVGVQRPDWGFGPDNTWPSGHVTAVMSVGLVAVWPAARRWRPFIATVGVAASVLVGHAVVLLRWHRFGDVVAAALVCLLWASLCAAAFRFRPVVHRRLAHAHKVVTATSSPVAGEQPRSVASRVQDAMWGTGAAHPLAGGGLARQVEIRTLVGTVIVMVVSCAVALAVTGGLMLIGVQGLQGRAAHHLGYYALWGSGAAVGLAYALAAAVLPVGELRGFTRQQPSEQPRPAGAQHSEAVHDVAQASEPGPGQ